MPVWLINILVSIALSVVSMLIQQALGKGGRDVAGYRGKFQTGGKNPQSFLLGTVGVAGKLEYRNTWGSVGGVPNAYLVDVISLGDVPVTGITGLYVNSQAVTVASSGHVTQGYPVTIPVGAGTDNSHLWFEFLGGGQTAANSYLTGKFGSDPDRPWQSDMIGRGVPYVTLTALVDKKNLWSGFPTFMVQAQGIKLYDPRQDSTAGGSGSQRWDTPSTWAFSDNNIVAIYNILRGIHYDGDLLWGGGVSSVQLPYDAWSAAMDASDLSISLVGGGTEKQFRCGREVFLNERPADVISELLVGANARIARAAGKYYILVGMPDTADLSFTDDDVIVTEATTFDVFPNLDQVVNGATATYMEPLQAWEFKETAPYYRSDLEAADDGRRQLVGLDLKTTFSGTQAQRIIKAAVEESRRFRRHVVILPPQFRDARPLSVLAWTSAHNGYEDKLFLVTSRSRLPWGNVLVGLQEIDPADYDWTPEDDEQPLTFAPMTPVRPAPQEVEGFYVEADYVVDNDGIERRPAIRVHWDGDMPDVRTIKIKVRLDDGDIPVWEGRPVDFEAGEALISANAILPETDYEVSGEYEPIGDRPTVETDWYPVTTGPYKYGPDDIGELETGNLAPNAVSEVYAAYYASAVIAAGGGVYTDLLAIDDVEVPASASGVAVSFATLCHHFGDDAVPEFKVTRTDYPSGSNAVDVFDGPGSFVFNANPNPFGSDLPYKKMGTSLTFNDEPAAGSYSYALTFRGHNGTFSWRSIDASHSSLVINLAKR